MKTDFYLHEKENSSIGGKNNEGGGDAKERLGSLNIVDGGQEEKLLLPKISCIAGKEVITLEKEG